MEVGRRDPKFLLDIIYGIMGGVQVFLLKDVDFMYRRESPDTFGSLLIFKADVDFDTIVAPQINYCTIIDSLDDQWEQLYDTVKAPKGF